MGEARSRFQTASVINHPEATMRYPVSNDPEVLHAHRMRAAIGLTVALFLVAGSGALIVGTPAPIAVETPHPGEAINPRNPEPAANATVDDPPVNTF
jgi:hypothetical protein